MKRAWKITFVVFITIALAGTLLFVLNQSQSFQLFQNNSAEPPESEIFDNGPTYQIKHIWPYRGSTWRYKTEISKSAYEYFSGLERTSDYSEYVYNNIDDNWMIDLAEQFENVAKQKEWDKFRKIEFVLSFVQNLEYTSDKVTTGYDQYPRYSIETIVEQKGDCEDTSILFTSIAKAMNFGTALIVLKDKSHMGAGIRISKTFINNWSQVYPLTYFQKNEKYYAYCETTATGWRIGEIPDRFSNPETEIIEI